MDASIANDPILSRLPLPNSLRCPALELFRKYHYPDGYALSCFSNETANVLKEISQVMTEPKPNVLEWKPRTAINDTTKETIPGKLCESTEQSTNKLE